MYRKYLLPLLLVVPASSPWIARAQDIKDDQIDPAIVDLEAITVSGTQPGPGLWKVTRGDSELWIMGSLSPLPSRITWNSAIARSHVAKSQEVIWEPMFTIETDTGFFKSIYLGVKLYQTTKNPDGKTLKDVLPAEVYERWSQTKQRYLQRDRGVERKRPLVAADELFKAAIRRSGLTDKQLVQTQIKDAAKDHDVKTTLPRVTVKITDPNAALKEARAITLNDVDCLVATLDAIDQDLPRMVANANAWATGDIDAISFGQIERRDRLCSDAFSSSDLAKNRGVPDVRASSKASWMRAADKALGRNRVSFSVVPLQDILGTDGYAALLAAKGYNIQAP